MAAPLEGAVAVRNSNVTLGILLGLTCVKLFVNSGEEVDVP